MSLGWYQVIKVSPVGIEVVIQQWPSLSCHDYHSLLVHTQLMFTTDKRSKCSGDKTVKAWTISSKHLLLYRDRISIKTSYGSTEVAVNAGLVLRVNEDLDTSPTI